jgi:putative PIN family toxin of toxin-antitoxin system
VALTPNSIPRLVLDTHVWLDWLVFDDPGIVRIRNAVGTGRAEAYIDAVCEEELVRVLARGFAKRELDAQAQAAALATCRRIAKRIDAAAPEAARAGLPRCGDPDDQKFLEAALAANASFLITKDRKLLALGNKRGIPFRIVRPDELRLLTKDP